MDCNFIEFGDCRDIMRDWKHEGIRAQMCVTSPPYFGLRDYGHAGQIGLEQTPEQYIAAMVEVFRCVRDVLADDGTLWLNIGDSYNTQPAGNKTPSGFSQTRPSRVSGNGDQETVKTGRQLIDGLKKKDLIGIPWMLAFALRADGWYLRQDIIWHKPNPMPESVTDRCTKAHEYIFLLSKSERYYFDSDAMKEPAVSKKPAGNKRHKYADAYAAGNKRHKYADAYAAGSEEHRTKVGLPALRETRNRRSVWTVATRPYKGAHFATFPPSLIEPCILAGSRPGDVVLDPFMGSGTTAAVSVQHGRQYIGCELNEDYWPLQKERICVTAA